MRILRWLLLIPLACGAPPAPPLEPDDFTLHGVPLYADTTEIRLTYGAPDSATSAENPFASEPLLIWHYPGFEARFTEGVAAGYFVHAGDEATLRSVRIGTPADSVLRLYGTPATSMPSSWTYVDIDEEAGLRVVDFGMDADTVVRIYVGRAVR